MKILDQRILFRDSFSYCAHPFISKLPGDEWGVVFNRSVRRPFLLHPPNDPHFYNVMIRSSDQGASWTTPRIVPGYDWHGVECAGLTSLADGLLMLNQWRFKWHPLETARKLAAAGEKLYFPEDWVSELQISSELHTLDMIPDNPAEVVPWARGSDGTYVHFSSDGGHTWDRTVKIDTAPYSGGYGMRGGLQLADGTILLPFTDVPNYRIAFLVRSSDGGQTWEPPIEIARKDGYQFEEPTLITLRDGRILMILRENTNRRMHQTFSADNGRTWSTPEPLGFEGYPAHLLRMADGRLLAVYGYRYEPFGIRAVISEDEGLTWNDKPLIIRDDLPNRDLGYPAAVQADDGTIFTVYYGQDSDGVTCIQATRFALTE